MRDRRNPLCKQLTDSPLYFLQLCRFDSSRRVENHTLFHSENTIGTNEAFHGEAPALEIGGNQRNRKTVASRLTCNLAQNQIVAREINDNEGRPSFCQIED